MQAYSVQAVSSRRKSIYDGAYTPDFFLDRDAELETTTALHNPSQGALVGIAILLLGGPVYTIWHHLTKERYRIA